MFYSTAQRAITLDAHVYTNNTRRGFPSSLSTDSHVGLIKKKMSVLFSKWGGDDDLRVSLSATGDAVRSETASGAGVSLLFFVLQEVGRPVSRHPSRIYHLKGRVPTGVVHAAQ